MESTSRRQRRPWAGIILNGRSLFPSLMAVFALNVMPLRAAVVLDLPFDDPRNMIKKADGISRATEDFAEKKATLSSGKGGRVLPGFNEGPEGAVPDAKGKPTSEARLLALKEPAMEKSPFLRATLAADPLTRSVGVRILPNSTNESASALFSYQNERGAISGGFDFFFRATSEGGGFPKIGFRSNCGPLGMDMYTDPVSGAFFLRAFTNEKSIDSNGDGVADKEGVSGKSVKGVTIESGAIYHAAIVFRTSPEGLITMDLCLQKGMGTLKIADTVVASVRGFGLLAKDPRGTDDQDLISIYLGKSKFAQTLDLAAFRIYKPQPEIFPGIDGKE